MPLKFKIYLESNAVILRNFWRSQPTLPCFGLQYSISKQHVDKLLVKISKRIGVLGRIRNNLTVDGANKVYQSLVLPVMDYCDVAWSSIGKIERDKLDRAQRRAAKIVLKTKDSDAEKNLRWLPLSMRRDMHTINLTFKCLKGSPPMLFKDYFEVFRTIHNEGKWAQLTAPQRRSVSSDTLIH